jgi:phospholipase/carboxylesterase
MTDNVQRIDSGPAVEKLGLVHRVRLPGGEGPHPTLVMIHGFKGTEDVTWIFARSASPDWLVISMRAPFAADQGYQWYIHDADNADDTDHADDHNNPEDFNKGLAALGHFIEKLPDVYPVDRTRMVLLGFSQGAAMAYAYGLHHPILGIAALCGFIPRYIGHDLPPLDGLPILILHGTQDTTIPIKVARENRDRLQAAGADVTYQESETGHKVSAGEMRELTNWLATRRGIT